MSAAESPLVGIIMGSQSDWDTMRPASEILTEFGVPHECRVVSAHRTPEWMVEYAQTAVSRGLEVIIAGAGGAAHLPGMVASLTTLPVLGVPVGSKWFHGVDSLLSIVQMPGGVPWERSRSVRRGPRMRGCWHPGFWQAVAPSCGRSSKRFVRLRRQSDGAGVVMSAALAPGAAIGILGGGQLGRMLAWPARRMGYRVVIFSDEAEGPAAQWADQIVVGGFDELDKVAQFAKLVSVATFETEHVPLPCVDEVLKHTRVRPSRCVLEVAQNRQLEKETIRRLGGPLPKFTTINPAIELAQQVEAFGMPCVLKTTTAGTTARGSGCCGSPLTWPRRLRN